MGAFGYPNQYAAELASEDDALFSSTVRVGRFFTLEELSARDEAIARGAYERARRYPMNDSFEEWQTRRSEGKE